MKQIFGYCLFAITLIIAGCSDPFDDSKIWDKLDDHESRIVKLEELCKQMNTNISSLQTIVSALQNNDYVTGVAPVTKNGEIIGYTIIFTKSQPITIYHGENGKDGQNGTNGVDGKDGSTPVIGVKMDDDGVYYWTLNGEWLTDENGNKIKAVGTDGKDRANGENGTDGQDGANGKDGITPQLKIEDGYWYISYDNGATWTQLGKATGEDGKDGQDGTNDTNGVDGDSFFQSVTQDENNVYIVLADGTEIAIPKKINLDDVKLTYIPRYDDGKATVIYSYKSDSYVGLDFEVSPASKAADWSDITTVKAVYTESRAGVEFVDMDIMSWSTDATNGTISVKASGKNLSDDFFDGNQSASVRIVIENDDVNIISEYIPMVAERLHMQESNEIWYTATKKVTPYASDVFGANIVSNVWNKSTGKGIISFNGDVTSIGNMAFYECSSLTSITIPEGVTSIGNMAFYGCSSLTSITIPEGVTSIGGSAFFDCTLLTSVTIGDSVTSIGYRAFYNCTSLTSVTIGNSVTSIGERAFYNCTSLTSVTIPDSVTSIVDSAFEGCESLARVDISDLSAWCKISFSSLFANPLLNGAKLYLNGSELTDITIPSDIAEIKDITFYNCTSLTSVTIPDSVTSIGDWAFSDCTSLTSVTIGDSVTSIGDYAFIYCTSLTSVTIPDSVTEIGDGAFVYCTSLTSVTIGDSVTSIGENAFSRCSSLTSVTIPDSVTSIGFGTFYQCTSLTSITIGNSVTSIGGSAFSDCTSLTSVTIGDSVTSIGNYAFYGCTSLTSVTIGDSVTSIGDWAFFYCTSLTSVYCKPTTPPEGDDDMFSYNASGRKIYVPMASVSAYKSAPGWSDYAADIVGYDF